jgi:GAF domain-containing protein
VARHTPVCNHAESDIPALLNTLVLNVRSERDRLRQLAEAPPQDAAARLADDAEPRVQNEQLVRSTRQLDLLLAAHEQLFLRSPTALLRTDTSGMIVRFNTAARRLLALDRADGCAVPLANLFSAADRGAVRGLVSRLRLVDDTAKHLGPLEATAEPLGGGRVPVSVAARRSTEDDCGRLMLLWEVKPRGTSDEPQRPEPVAATADTIAAAVHHMAAGDGLAGTAARFAETAASLVPSADHAGVLLVRGRRSPEHAAATGRAADCDRLQLRHEGGPALTALAEGRPVVVADLAGEARWPWLAAATEQYGARSLLAVPFEGSRGLRGVLTLYSDSRGAFSSGDLPTIRTFLVHAAIVLSAADLEENLRVAIATREEVGRAVGILMERHRIAASAAFDMLAYVSQVAHAKLRDIAARVSETGEDLAAIAAGYRGR